jgi:hypothetical protein
MPDASVISMSSVNAPALERCGREEEEVQGLVPATTPNESTAGKLVIIGRALSPTASMRSLMLIEENTHPGLANWSAALDVPRRRGLGHR